MCYALKHGSLPVSNMIVSDIRFTFQPVVVLPRMLGLVAENASLEDCLYYLDKAVTDGVITVEVFLKEVRRLARKQFIARATAKRVSRTISTSQALLEWQVLKNMSCGISEDSPL